MFDPVIIKHELLHVLGKTHEHSRPDVNQVLDVFIDNVKPRMKGNFDVQKYWEDDENFGVDDFDTPYDLNSIMQYPSCEHSRFVDFLGKSQSRKHVS